MRLTAATRYALEALIFMAFHKDKNTWGSNEIAKEVGLPDYFLPKNLYPLVRAGILHSSRGPNGGYGLIRAAQEITLLEVIEAVEGKIQSRGLEGRSGKLATKIQATLDKAVEASRRELRMVKLADLVGK